MLSLALAQYTSVPTIADIGDQGVTNTVAEVQPYAASTVASLKSLVTPTNFRLLGFASTNEVIHATNGEPILIYTLVLDKLKMYSAGDPFSGLLGPVDRAIIPVLVNTRVRSSGTLRLTRNLSWTNESWGQPTLISNLVRTVRGIPLAQLKPGTVPYAVQIPVFNMWFVGYRDQKDETVFKSVFPLNPLGLPQGGIIS